MMVLRLRNDKSISTIVSKTTLPPRLLMASQTAPHQNLVRERPAEHIAMEEKKKKHDHRHRKR